MPPMSPVAVPGVPGVLVPADQSVQVIVPACAGTDAASAKAPSMANEAVILNRRSGFIWDTPPPLTALYLRLLRCNSIAIQILLNWGEIPMLRMSGSEVMQSIAHKVVNICHF